MTQIDEFFLENKPLFSGKIRDIYDYGDDRLLIRTSNKISAFDFVFDDEILNKGSLLTNITKIWFSKTQDIIQRLIDYAIAQISVTVDGLAGPDKIKISSFFVKIE